MSQSETVEIFRGGVHLATPHAPGDYPGLLVVLPEGWEYAVIIPENGRSFTARGGEWAPACHLRSGAIMQGFTLRPGDQVTRVRTDLPHALAEWRVLRAP